MYKIEDASVDGGLLEVFAAGTAVCTRFMLASRKSYADLSIVLHCAGFEDSFQGQGSGNSDIGRHHGRSMQSYSRLH